MSKKRNKPQNQSVTAVVKRQAQDSFSNPLARMGLGTNNLMNSTQYPITRLTRDYNLMNSLYRNSWITKKIINTIPEDMCKNWFSLTADMQADVTDRFIKLEKKTLVREKILEGLMWGRLYGGAGAVMLIDGHEHILIEPLEIDTIMPNSFKGLLVVDRWSGIFPSNELITDICDPEFGLPMYYNIINTSGAVVQKVHHSRVIRFVGRKLPFFENQAEIHWGAAEMEHIFEELVNFDNTNHNVASLVFQANLLVNKVDGLEQLLTLTDPQAQRDFYAVKSAQNELRNNSAMMIIGKDEDVQSLQYAFAGLDAILESQALNVAGAAEIPVTKLFGRSPAGMNATGESDLQNYYDMVSQQQTTVLKPKIDKLLPVMFMSEFGMIPDDLDIKFNPIASPSEEKLADIVGKKVESIDKVFTSGIISQKHARKELHELSYTTNMFSSITDDDIENADDTTNTAGELTDFGFLGGGLNEQGTIPTEKTDRGAIPQEPKKNKQIDSDIG